MFELSEDHEHFRKVVREFALAEVAPHAAQWDRDHALPVSLIHQMGDLGSSASRPESSAGRTATLPAAWR